jgi:hypothetical protein
VIYTQVSSSDLADLAAAIKYEQDGAVMMRDLRRGLRAAAKPAETAAKAAIMSMPSSGLRNVGGSLRASIRREIKTDTRLTARKAQVKIKVTKQTVRGFKNPAKRLNSAQPWRHPVRPWKRQGNKVVNLPRSEWTWVAQRSAKPRWFDDAVRGKRADYEAAVRQAMNDAADRIARNT